MRDSSFAGIQKTVVSRKGAEIKSIPSHLRLAGATPIGARVLILWRFLRLEWNRLETI